VLAAAEQLQSAQPQLCPIPCSDSTLAAATCPAHYHVSLGYQIILPTRIIHAIVYIYTYIYIYTKMVAALKIMALRAATFLSHQVLIRLLKQRHALINIMCHVGYQISLSRIFTCQQKACWGMHAYVQARTMCMEGMNVCMYVCVCQQKACWGMHAYV